jgi:hypothetical protein
MEVGDALSTMRDPAACGFGLGIAGRRWRCSEYGVQDERVVSGIVERWPNEDAGEEEASVS